MQVCGRGIPSTCNFTMVASPMETPPSSQSAKQDICPSAHSRVQVDEKPPIDIQYMTPWTMYLIEKPDVIC